MKLFIIHGIAVLVQKFNWSEKNKSEGKYFKKIKRIIVI